MASATRCPIRLPKLSIPMRFQRILEQVYFRPWLISPAAHATIRALLDSKLAASADGISGKSLTRPTEDLFGDPLPVMAIVNGDAIIPVKGIIGMGFSQFEKTCGVVDVDDIAEDLANAQGNSMVRRIFFDFDTPGGSVPGVPELAATIARCSKPTTAFTRGQMNSAGMYLAAGCDAIFSTLTADVGCVGVYQAYLDKSLLYEQNGVEVKLFASGPYKGMGFPGTSLSAAQEALIQAEVDDMNAMFSGFVKKYRSRVSDDALQGQSFRGDRAAQAYLTDGVVGSLDELRARVR